MAKRKISQDVPASRTEVPDLLCGASKGDKDRSKTVSERHEHGGKRLRKHEASLELVQVPRDSEAQSPTVDAEPILSSKYIVLDTETTDLLPRQLNPAMISKFPATVRELWKGCGRIVELAWAVYSSSGELLQKGCDLIRPEGFTIPLDAQAIHRISTEEALEGGISIRRALRKLHRALSTHGAPILVAHNVTFDYNILRNEMATAGKLRLLKKFEGLAQRCTWEEHRKPGCTQGPCLGDLYRTMFGGPPPAHVGKCHRANVDVELCAAIFFQKAIPEKTMEWQDSQESQQFSFDASRLLRTDF